MRINEEQFTSSPIDSPKDEANDCTVISFAYVMNISYEEAHEFMRLAGRKPRKGAPMIIALKSGEETIAKKYKKRLELLPFKWNETLRRQPTVRKLLDEVDDGMHIAIVRGHVFAVNKNKVVDSSKVRAGRRCHHVYKVYDI